MHPYDIILYINLNKYMWKNRYNVIYNGASHSILFDVYVDFLIKYGGYEASDL